MLLIFYIYWYSHLVHHVSTCARPCTVTITSNLTNFIFLKEILSYQFMSIIFLCGSVNHWKNLSNFPGCCFIDQSASFFQNMFSPPLQVLPHFSPSQRVATCWCKCLGPCGPPSLVSCVRAGVGLPTGPTLPGWCPLVGRLVLLPFPISTQLVPQVAKQFRVKCLRANVGNHLRRFQVYWHTLNVFHLVA